MYTKFLHYLSDIFLEKVYIWSIITNQETKFSDMPYHQKENNETDTSKNRVKKTTSRGNNNRNINNTYLIYEMFNTFAQQNRLLSIINKVLIRFLATLERPEPVLSFKTTDSSDRGIFFADERHNY